MTLEYEAGRYKAHVTRWALSKSSKGNPQFVLSFKPAGRLDPNDPNAELIPCADAERSVFRVINANTIEYVAQDLAALGYDRSDFDGLDPESPNSFDFANLEIEVDCKHDIYEGKTREKWNFAFGGGGMNFGEPLDSKDIGKLNALFGAKLKGAGSGKLLGAAAKASRQPNPVGVGGDDIPF